MAEHVESVPVLLIVVSLNPARCNSLFWKSLAHRQQYLELESCGNLAVSGNVVFTASVYWLCTWCVTRAEWFLLCRGKLSH